MKAKLLALFLWFLVIQSLRVESATMLSIPMQDETHCRAAMELIQSNQSSKFARANYVCVDAGVV